MPHQRCFWKVRVWDEAGKVSDWSPVHFWQTGLLTAEDWKAKWISNRYAEVSRQRESFSQPMPDREFTSSDTAALYLRKEFTLSGKIERATAYVSGLGYYELYLDANKVGDRVLDPVFTDYQKTVKYAAYDLTEQLQNQGPHCIAAILGNGFYNHQERDLFQMEKANWKTPPKLLLQLMIEYKDGSQELILSDTSWKWSYGPIVYNSIRGGETIDARKRMPGWNSAGFEDTEWKRCETVPAPPGRLEFQYMPPMRETRTLEPVTVWNVNDSTTVFDFGENLTGYADITVKTEEGQRIIVYYNEALNPDSNLNVRHSSGHTWGRFQKGILIGSGEKDYFEPRFTYHGFRYVQLEGIARNQIEAVEARAVHTDLATIGHFSCSNDRLNQLHAAVRRTLLNSVHSMPGEEPTREKMGWTFDGGMVTMESYLMNFDAINTYKKYLQDLIDAQEPNGHIPPIVPTNGWGFLELDESGKRVPILYDDPWWGGTIFFVTDKLLEFTADTSMVRKAYPAAKAYVDFVRGTAEDHIVSWSLGDWLDLTHGSKGWGPGLTPVEQTSTAASYYFCQRTAAYAKMLGRQGDAEMYSQYADTIKQVFNEQFFDPQTGWYANNSQTAQALPLYLGLVPKGEEQRVANRLIDAVKTNDFHTSVGFVGVNPLLKYLSENGQLSTVYRMVTQEESPGWLHFVKDEKSTMGENLNAQGYGTSHHPFATNVGFWLYYYLGGIQVDFTKDIGITLQPGFETELEWVECSYNSLYGKIASNWKKEQGQIIYSVELPPNQEALLKLPAGFELVGRSELERYGEGVVIPPGMYELVFSAE